MSALKTSHPALAAFVGGIGAGFAFGQLWIERFESGFRLRHVQDRSVPEPTLKTLLLEELREWSRVNAAGAFRPLKGAPDLRAGWVCRAMDAPALEHAVNHVYPGGIADWFHARTAVEPAISLREFLGRQTGMYRGTKALEGDRAVSLVRACCGETRCLKQRFWEVEGIACDSVPPKSEVPCLEPCAVMLDFARREARMIRETPITIQLSPMDLDTVRSVMEHAVQGRFECTGLRMGDTGEPLNPRRILLALEHLRMQVGERSVASSGSTE